MTLSAGKLRGLQSLADDAGIFKMIATDQRPPIFNALAKHDHRDPSEVRYDEVAAVKKLLIRVLAPGASAVLVDPVWGHPHALADIPGRVGLISTLEDYSFELNDGERWSHPIGAWTVEKIKRCGAGGVKVLVWHRPDLREDTRAHQDAFVQQIGEACEAHDIPFILEILCYPKPGEDGASARYAAAKPERVLASLEHFAQDRFKVDLFKLEFPADLKYCREFAGGAFDGTPRDALYALEDVQKHLATMHRLSPVPWVLLSAGVGPREFALNLELAFAAGASGFLAGRAVWLDALDAYPDLDAVEQKLRRASLPYLRQISALADTALPWHQHPAYGNAVQLEQGGNDWYKEYA